MSTVAAVHRILDLATKLRNENAGALLANGLVDLRSLLALPFGQWPPKGLNIHPDILHEKIIPIGYEGNFEGANKRFLGYYAPFGGNIAINANHKMINKVLYSTVAHEAIHALQYDMVERRGRPVIFMEREDLEATRIINKQLKAHPRMKDSLLMSFKRAAGFALKASKMDYLWEGVELQARLLQTIGHGYPLWKRMPATRDELWMALGAAGLDAPPFVQAHLRKLPKDDSAQTFNTGGIIKISPTSQMNTAFTQVPDKGKEMLWRETLPMLYADLIEMMGDIEGRARFGMGKNPLLKIFKVDDPATPAPQVERKGWFGRSRTI